MARRKRKVVTHKQYARMRLARLKYGAGAGLSKSRGHIPVKVLQRFLDKMPAHEEKLRRLIAKRKAAGE